ncbi:hypothetical protein BHM03_00021896, partial [Ensete ventricosum]
NAIRRGGRPRPDPLQGGDWMLLGPARKRLLAEAAARRRSLVGAVAARGHSRLQRGARKGLPTAASPIASSDDGGGTVRVKEG